MWLIFAFVWLFLSVVVAVFATLRAHSGTDFFVISLIISPLGAVILAVFLPPVEDTATTINEIIKVDDEWQDAAYFDVSVRNAVEIINDSVPLAQVDSAINDLRTLYFQSGKVPVSKSDLNLIINEAKYRELKKQLKVSVWK
ncbi:hypothetical protein BIZ37_10620 [Photobacterium sp. BZF1]|uniref:hypothetical protein n=1 Tax=Photobacterium sp. BZF1 TaxID=1904457 RepID=UPI001653A76D|nr:hypothetical protein [Photobacterium sp. BZF1]MBC7003012.1 hypothetical protein [Photobacterium sp. BZF1]